MSALQLGGSAGYLVNIPYTPPNLRVPCVLPFVDNIFMKMISLVAKHEFTEAPSRDFLALISFNGA